MTSEPSWSAWLSRAVTGVMLVCAVAVTGLLVRREMFGGSTGDFRVEVGLYPQPDWLEYATGTHRIGPADARAVVVEFTDYECPWCQRMEGRLEAALAKYPNDLAVVYRHRPLPNHVNARAAAIASVCAGEQARFPSMHRILFAGRDSFSTLPWREFARRAGVPDIRRFESCLTSEAPESIVAQDLDAAARLGVAGTPVLLVNGMRYLGAMPVATLDSLIVDLVGKPGAKRREH